jgi:hypothetical protein
MSVTQGTVHIWYLLSEQRIVAAIYFTLLCGMVCAKWKNKMPVDPIEENKREDDYMTFGVALDSFQQKLVFINHKKTTDDSGGK